METTVMVSSKILPALVVSVLLATTGLASAQNGSTRHQRVVHAHHAVPAQTLQWRDPNAGTYWENLAPYGAQNLPGSYAGTVWDNIAPY